MIDLLDKSHRERPLGGGCIAEVSLLEFEDGEKLIAKRDGGRGGDLELEGWMLRYLAETSELAVPEVHYCDSELLLMSWLPEDGGLTVEAETQAAEQVAALHDVSTAQFGLERDTLIGPLHQPNPREADWITFFRDHRLLYMADLAKDRGRLPSGTRHQIDRLANRLPDLIAPPERPCLLHGDLWGGNILASRGRLSGFIDPAIYYGHAEMDLAFSTLFGSLGKAFFQRYGELRPLEPGFFEERRDLYNLYPLLVHTALFGGGYPGAVKRITEGFL
ncbi:fructosamine kinase family protein [Fodinicurvata halophila]|uniref:Fructosamine kinase family protein n=1 Tax=Fodinicurvata halophila TaxID=1419723 RepID=A0ABV8UI28_9PROT